MSIVPLVRIGMPAGLFILIILAVIGPTVSSLADPWGALTLFMFGPLGSLRHVGNVAELATPIMMTGLASTLMFRAGMFNIGAEGSFFLGGLLTVAAALVLPLPGWALVPVSVVLGASGGCLVCAVPGALRTRFGASELVTSLMLNYVALYLGLFLLNYYLRDPDAGTMASFRIPVEARLPYLVAGTRINAGLVVALASCVIGGIYVFATRHGLRMRIVGSNPGFASHLGLPQSRIAWQMQVAGGFIAAAAGGIEVLGLYQRFSWESLPGQGWSGITVAILAANNPFMIVPAAFFLSYLQIGGDLLARNFDVPSEAVGLIQALVIVCATAKTLVANPTLLRWAALAGRRGNAS